MDDFREFSISEYHVAMSPCWYFWVSSSAMMKILPVDWSNIAFCFGWRITFLWLWVAPSHTLPSSRASSAVLWSFRTKRLKVVPSTFTCSPWASMIKGTSLFYRSEITFSIKADFLSFCYRFGGSMLTWILNSEKQRCRPEEWHLPVLLELYRQSFLWWQFVCSHNTDSRKV